MNWHEVTALFGGSFDPPHLGHREAVRGLFIHPGVKQVWIVPTGRSPFKNSMTSTEDRLEMTRINFQSTLSDSFPQDIRLELREVENFKRDPFKPNYTYDTLLALRSQVKSLAMVVGSDQLAQLTSWYRFPEVLSLAHWIVLMRKPDGEKLAQETLSLWKASGLLSQTRSNQWNIGGTLKNNSHSLLLVPTEAPAISSTLIREEIARTGIPPSHSLLPEVDAYLKSKRLYGMKSQ